ncbi:MAG: DUF2769 domain-containing protein [Nitrospirae bacterium]|nr:DUF2769 domain-containing protein [Nitrospirota bacterium]
MIELSDFDRFGVEGMTKEEYIEKQEDVVKNCLCMKCPTYVKGDAPTGYCFPLVGTSRIIHAEKNCICETCPVYKENELDHTFYCTRCSELCQTQKKQVLSGP